MITMRFEGGAQLAKVLNGLPSRVNTSVTREALRTVAAPPIRDRAAALVRRAPGSPDIAQNIVVSTGRGDSTSSAIVVGPSTAKRSDQPGRSFATQGKYLEFGTSRMPMFAFLRPAFDAEAPGTLKGMASAMWAALISRGFGSTRSSGGGGGTL
jgi:HK97 gp10 family phage protein